MRAGGSETHGMADRGSQPRPWINVRQGGNKSLRGVTVARAPGTVTIQYVPPGTFGGCVGRSTSWNFEGVLE